MLENDNCSPNCGCRISSFSTTEECPVCKGRLRLIGQAQLLEFKLTCRNCDYQSSLLSQEELQVLI